MDGVWCLVPGMQRKKKKKTKPEEHKKPEKTSKEMNENTGLQKWAATVGFHCNLIM